ncbi:hypothetical protein RDI58_015818 [Solanum bulbocastanum]|uniref:Uncharacterized protein n=1 Tax=Solanum bulbocastanum TaxID=147425 RepID=A0AAN8TEZ0_SOLBU
MDVEFPYSWVNAIRQLTELRYLALYVGNFELQWISHLRYLQTLQVKSHKKLCIRGASLWEMTELRHVNIEQFSLEGEYNDQESSTTMLENLKTFRTWYISRYDINPRFWWKFSNLEELSLRIKYAPKFPLFPISEVHTYLHSLFLDFTLTEFWDSVGWESYFVFSSNLRDLSLNGCFLMKEMVSNIARLRKLESLKLKGGTPLERTQSYCWDVRNVEFRALKYLILLDMQMDEWIASEESFPVLEELVIQDGYYFKEIPPSFVDIPTLRLIEVIDCDDSLVASVMNIKSEIEETSGCDRLQVLIL